MIEEVNDEAWTALTTTTLREIADLADDIAPRITEFALSLEEAGTILRGFHFTLEADGTEVIVNLGVDTTLNNQACVSFEFPEDDDDE